VRKIIIGLLAVGFVAFGIAEWRSLAADEAVKPTDDKATAGAVPSATPAPASEPALAAGATPPAAAGAAAPVGGEVAGGAPAGGTTSPIERVNSTPKGQLKNPYTDYAGLADEGHKKFMSFGCNGCHGGGGGMCPPLTSDIWFYGKDDDTLFRLVTLGSEALQKQGYSRIGESVGPMPPFGQIIKTDDDLWKVIAWIRSVNPHSLLPPKSYAPPPCSANEREHEPCH
jgi:hypothetical protein